MSPSPRSAPARVLLGLDGAGLALRDAAGAVRWIGHGEAGRLGAFIGARRNAMVEVVVADDVAVHWVQRPPAGAQGLHELRAVAAARCAHLFGGTPADWWVAGDWQAVRPFVCAAVPRALAQPVRRQLEAAGLRSDWQSAWARLCNRRAREIPAQGWSACRGPGRVTLWSCAGGRVTSVQSFAVPRDADPGHVEARVAERQTLEALNDGAIAPAPVHWLTPSAWQGMATEAEAALQAAQPAGAAAR